MSNTLILPSFLEYSAESLVAKLQLVKANKSSFINLQNSPDGTLYFHLDFVMPEFARVRKVKPSLDLNTVLTNILDIFDDQNLDLSIHLMGTVGDITIQAKDTEMVIADTLQKSNITTVFYYSTKTFKNKKEEEKGIFEILPYSAGLGAWWDLNQWKDETNLAYCNRALLMTVAAGKSGQKLTENHKKLAIEVAKNTPKVNFIFDGGWELAQLPYDNIQVVSYTSFWQEFDKVAKIA